MKKGCLIFLGVMVLGFMGIAMLVSTVAFLTSGIVSSADGFFTEIANENYGAAHGFLSETLQKDVSVEQLRTVSEQNNWTEFESAYWNNRSINNGTGELDGSLTTNTGGTIPISMTFVKENSDWKIAFFGEVGSGELTASDIPSNEEARELADEWTTEFCKAVSGNDFSKFREKTAQEFQDTVSLEELSNTFSQFVELNMDLKWVREHEPVIDPEPSITANGLLRLQGYYPVQPKVVFDFEFLRRANNWELMSVDFNVNPAPKLDIPSNTEMIEMARFWTDEFCQGVTKRDFTDFHGQLHSSFSSELSLENFTKTFQGFLDQNADLSWVRDVDPVLDSEPTITGSGVLTTEGHFPADPVVVFRYHFIQEDSKWKMSGININVAASSDAEENENENNGDGD